MKILLYGINFAPELTGVGKYSGELAFWLSKRASDVRVVTAPPYYPDWKVAKGFARYWFSSEVVQGVRVSRCPLWVPTNPGGAKRILHLASFAISSFPMVLKQGSWRPDIVFVVAPALFCAPAGWLLARLCGAKAWLHFQDFETDAAFELGILNGKKRRAFVEFVERQLLRRFDCVSTISEKMLDRLHNKGVEPEKSYLFPNWVDVNEIRPSTRPNVFRAELGILDDTVVALYSGNMGKKQGLEILAEAAKQLRNRPDILFLFSGNGAGRQELVDACQGLPNVRFIGLQPAERLNDLLNSADIHLLPQRQDAADLVMPSKLTGMLASGRPVIGTAAPGTQIERVLADSGGYCVAPGATGALCTAIMQLSGQAEDRARRGKLARKYAMDHLSHEAILNAFTQHLRHLYEVGDSPARMEALTDPTTVAKLRRRAR